MSETIEQAVTAVETKVETAVSDPAVVQQAETAVEAGVAKVDAAVAAAGGVAGIEADVSHDVAIAEAAAKGFVHKAEVTVGEVIAALVNRVHALEAHLGLEKPAIVVQPPVAAAPAAKPAA